MLVRVVSSMVHSKVIRRVIGIGNIDGNGINTAGIISDAASSNGNVKSKANGTWSIRDICYLR